MSKRIDHGRKLSKRLTATTSRPTSPRRKISSAKPPSVARKSFCRRSCSRAFTSARGRIRNGSKPRIPVDEHPCVLALKKLAQRTRRRHPDLVLREGRPALLQQHRDRRRRWRNPRRLSQEPHSRWPRLSGEILFPPRRHRLQDLDDEARPHRRRHLLGPMVSGMRTRDGAAGRRDTVLSDGDRIGAL